MKLNSNITIFAGVNAPFAGRETVDMFGRKQRAGMAGGLPFQNNRPDPIEQKRALAKKQAYKMVSDTFASERRIDDEFKEREDAVSRYHDRMSEANKKIREIDEEKEKLRLEYGVEADSQEQKDLEILEKLRQGSFEMSDEESKRAFELLMEGKSGGYTEYQQRALRLDAFKEPHNKDIYEAKKGIIEENAAIRSMAQERLKHHPMLDATEDAQKILESAGKEIIGMLKDEAVDHIDEKFEEELEKAEEKKEEEKKEEEKLEAAKERRKEMEALANPEKAEKEKDRSDSQTDPLSADPVTEAMLKMDKVRNDIKQEVSEMMSKMNLAAEDLKGIKVDELL